MENKFGEDQIKLFLGEYKKIPIWSNETLKKAFKYKFACGTVGYEEIALDYPLPSLRTLRRRLENLKFESGILDEVFDFLKIKTDTFQNNLDKHCAIVLDEMTIAKGLIYNTSTHSYIGKATLVNMSGKFDDATHALVIMLAGIGIRWKQIVAYYYTSNSVDGSQLKPIIYEIIKRAEEIGLLVHSVTSDMGSTNLALWKACNISASKYSKIFNSCPHPYDANRKLYYFHDTAHAFKNFKQGLLNNKFCIIDDKFVKKYGLPTNKILASHLKELCSIQEESLDFGLALAPKLKPKLLDSRNHFTNMKVSSATNVINHAVSSALNYVAKTTNNTDYITTAWLIGYASKWFKLMSSRSTKSALGKLYPEKFRNAIDFLEEFTEIISTMKVGKTSSWKPFQTGIIISTTSMIEITKYLLDHDNFQFVFGARFMQDCIENLFSVIRSIRFYLFI